MRKIEMKLVAVEGGEPLSYKANILGALKTPSNSMGVDYEEMSKVLPIIANVERLDAGAVLYLEEADHAVLVERMKAAKYQVVHELIFAMIEDVINAPEVPLEDVSAA